MLSETLYAREWRKLVNEIPQPVAFSGEIPEHEHFLSLDVLGTPVLLTRTQDGKLQAFINACGHRGARLVAGSGHSRSLVCPFHGWSYQHNGQLRGRPERESFDSDDETLALIPLPVVEISGIVFVSTNQEMPASGLSNALSGLEEELASYGFDEYRSIDRRHYDVKANWKLVNNLSLESYHFKVLHRESVAQVLESHAVVDTIGQHSRWAFPLKSIRELEHLDETQWPERLQGSCTYTLFPGVMVIVNSLGAQMIRAEPGDGPHHSRVTYVGMHAPHCSHEEAKAAFDFGGDVFTNEDLPIAEECQIGLAAARRDLVIGRNEPLLQFWHGLWGAM